MTEFRSIHRFRAAHLSLSFMLLAVIPQSTAAQDSTPSDIVRQLFEEDQADRSRATPPTPEDWAAITSRDEARRMKVHEFLRADLLESGEDLYHAAMVLQHAPGSEDILLAHILATAAAFLGHAPGKWLSAAALDRFLHRTEQPQRLGTQYVKVAPERPFESNSEAPWSQGAYVDWLPDRVRSAFDVGSLDGQKERVRTMRARSEGG